MRSKTGKEQKGICEHYQISDRTARMIVKELEQERGRYGDYTVLGDGALKRVNFLAFTDYWQFRKMLQDKNARKHVPVPCCSTLKTRKHGKRSINL